MPDATYPLADIEKYTGFQSNDLWKGIESLISSVEYTDGDNFPYIVREISNLLRCGHIDDLSIRDNIPYLVSKLRDTIKKKKSFKPLEDVFNILVNHSDLMCDQINDCLADCNMDYRVEYGGLDGVELYKPMADGQIENKSESRHAHNINSNERKENSMITQIFIGSSTRGIKHAEALKENLESGLKAKEIDFKCNLWKEEDMFELSKATIENLIRIADEIHQSHGYGILLFTPDDLVYLDGPKRVESKKYIVPRDNVIFEYGLFMGKLDRDHTFCVCPKDKRKSNVRLRLPSDLQGVTYAEYIHKWRPQESINAGMKDPARKIAAAIGKGIINKDADNETTILSRSSLGI